MSCRLCEDKFRGPCQGHSICSCMVWIDFHWWLIDWPILAHKVFFDSARVLSKVSSFSRAFILSFKTLISLGFFSYYHLGLIVAYFQFGQLFLGLFHLWHLTFYLFDSFHHFFHAHARFRCCCCCCCSIYSCCSCWDNRRGHRCLCRRNSSNCWSCLRVGRSTLPACLAMLSPTLPPSELFSGSFASADPLYPQHLFLELALQFEGA